jgi:hypothetical protein
MTRLEDLGVELLSDGRSVYYRPGDWLRVPPDLRTIIPSAATNWRR